MKVVIRLGIFVLPLSLLGLSQAHSNPLDSEAAIEEASYRSSFQGYVKDEDIEAGGWVEANRRVGEIGGWRTYLKQAQEPIDQSSPSNGDQKKVPSGEPGAGHSSHHGVK